MTLIEAIAEERQRIESENATMRNHFDTLLSGFKEAFQYFHGKEGIKIEISESPLETVLKASKGLGFIQVKATQSVGVFTVGTHNLRELCYRVPKDAEMLKNLVVAHFAHFLIGEASETKIPGSESVPPGPG